MPQAIKRERGSSMEGISWIAFGQIFIPGELDKA